MHMIKMTRKQRKELLELLGITIPLCGAGIFILGGGLDKLLDKLSRQEEEKLEEWEYRYYRDVRKILANNIITRGDSKELCIRHKDLPKVLYVMSKIARAKGVITNGDYICRLHEINQMREQNKD